jgi:hypothetical protein
MEIRGEVARDGFLICPSTDVPPLQCVSQGHQDPSSMGPGARLRRAAIFAGDDRGLPIAWQRRRPRCWAGYSGPRPHGADGYRCPGWPRGRCDSRRRDRRSNSRDRMRFRALLWASWPSVSLPLKGYTNQLSPAGAMILGAFHGSIQMLFQHSGRGAGQS